jgi:hypothetical protein
MIRMPRAKRQWVAVRHPYTGGDETLDREHGFSTRAAAVLDVAVAKLPEECWLHGRHNVLGACEVAQIGRADSAVLDAVAQPLAGILALGEG